MKRQPETNRQYLARVTRDGDTLTATVGRLAISVAASTPAEKLIARRAIARADLSLREPDDETGPGGSRRSPASQQVEAALTALLAEIGDKTPDRPVGAVSAALDWVAPRITESEIATAEGRDRAKAIALRIEAAQTLSEIQAAHAEGKALFCSSRWIDSGKAAALEAVELARRRASDEAISEAPEIGSGYGRHGLD